MSGYASGHVIRGARATNITLTLLDLAGTVALLLWGVHMVQTGVQRAFGAKLRSFLAHQLRNRASAFLAGLGTGVWDDTDALRETWQLDRSFTPSTDRELADAAHRRWTVAVERSLGWADL